MRCWIEIDLDVFRANIINIKKSLPIGTKYLSVVKANAYGCGAPELVKKSWDLVDAFAVANLTEAMEIKNHSKEAKIIILSTPLPDEIEAIVHSEFIPFVSTDEELERIILMAKAMDKIAEVHLKIDTGMGRIGFWHENNVDRLRRLCSDGHVKIGGIATHLSHVDKDENYTSFQRKNFRAWLKNFSWPMKNLMIHESSSFAVKNCISDGVCNGVRVGAMQYGIASEVHDEELLRSGIRPIFSLKSKVALIKNVPAGVKISYDGMYETTESAKIGVLSCGYADGIPVDFTNTGRCIINGHSCPVIGRVAMDQTMIKLNDCPSAKVGDEVLWLGGDAANGITIGEFSRAGRKILRESLCALSSRVTRIYK
ncbi:MAG: alanine racemase [Puniceicoccales bacterium]|jgi:alanine racemase|nr:alanine racemase [Puniceicoccales bacterium]